MKFYKQTFKPKLEANSKENKRLQNVMVSIKSNEEAWDFALNFEALTPIQTRRLSRFQNCKNKKIGRRGSW